MQTTEEYQEFGEYIQNMRKSVKWKREKLAEALGVSFRTIQNWENGENLSTRNLDELASNIRLVITHEHSRLRKIDEINSQFINKYLFKGGYMISG